MHNETVGLGCIAMVAGILWTVGYVRNDEEPVAYVSGFSMGITVALIGATLVILGLWF